MRLYETQKQNLDTDENSVRGIRGKRQFEFEKSLPKLFGTSIVDRYFSISDALFFDILTKSNEPLDTLIADEAPRGFPKRELVATKFLPQFYKFIDAQQEFISQEDDQEKKSKMGFRLAVLSYFLNIYIHQANDGNGQRGKLLALSYIHEFCPQYQNNFIPIKYDDGSEEDSVYIRTDDLDSLHDPQVDSTYPPNIIENDRKLFELLQKLYTVKLDSNKEVMSKKFTDEDMEEHHNKLINILTPLIDEAKSKFGITFSNKINLDLAINNGIGLISSVMTEISKYLSERYPGYHVNKEGDTTPFIKTAIHREFVLSAVLTEDIGAEFLKVYVEMGSEKLKNAIPLSDNKFLNFFHEFAVSLGTMEKEFDRVLTGETREKHEELFRKFEEKNILKN